MANRPAKQNQKSSTVEIANVITQSLKPWRDGEREAEISAFVNRHIGLLRLCVPEHFDRKAVRRTTADARRIIETADRLQKQIRAAAPEIRIRLDLGGNWSPVFFSELERVRRECKAAVRRSLTDGRGDEVKQQCVTSAWMLIARFSQARPGGSLFREVAGQIYEALTGEADVDLKRGCEAYSRHIAKHRRR